MPRKPSARGWRSSSTLSVGSRKLCNRTELQSSVLTSRANHETGSWLPSCLGACFLTILVVLMLLKNQVALVTGSGRGIGRAIAQLFAEEGAAVFLTARTEKELAATAEEISRNGGRAGYTAADLSRPDDCERVVAATQKKLGTIHILVNNAGHYGPVVPVEDYPLEEFDKVISVHLRAAFLLSKLVLPQMYEKKHG